MIRQFGIAIIGLGALSLASCGTSPTASADTSEPAAPATIATAWPSTLSVFGEGFPNPGDPCRRVGESKATADYLDDSAILVGCPGTATDAEAAAIIKAGGHAVGNEQGITLISIPQGDANVGMANGKTESGAAEQVP